MDADQLTGPSTIRDPELIARWRPVFDGIAALFSPEVRGVGNIPTSGGALLVGNHSLLWPVEGWVATRAIFEQRGFGAPTVGLAYDLLFQVPGLRGLLRRAGIVPARPETAETALRRGELVMVYPGGDFDACRSWRERDRIELAGHKGFVRLALRTGVPVLPMVTHGGQHAFVIIARGDHVARALRLTAIRVHVFPIMAGPLGVVSVLTPPPLRPTSISIEFLPPLDWTRYSAEAADDPDVVDACYEETRSAMQAAMDRLAAAHPHPVASGLGGLASLASAPARRVLRLTIDSPR